MATIGYARVSSTGQSLEVQVDQLRAAGCTKIFEEKISGTSQQGRAQLALALDYVRDGDDFLVTRLDRLARSMTDLRDIVDRLIAKNVEFRAIQQGAIDTSSSGGRLMLNMLAAVAEFEGDLRRERQSEGIAKAKAEGRYRGRPKSIDPEEVRRLLASGMGPTAVAQQLGVGRASVYRVTASKAA
ncbi:recombinase family protein [Brevundimonas sp.]|uniref:recombinase family protein n=1 Tax=Brevundimonas sp. TaxID=1871086 RepID=UPI002628397C|nr:recombinase family protein [Brevundimonas sp.]